MYWKFKLPLIIILALILGSIVYSGVNYYLNKDKKPAKAESAQTVPETPAAAPQQPLVISQTTTEVEAPKPFEVAEISDAADTAKPVTVQNETPLAPVPQPPAEPEPEVKPLPHTVIAPQEPARTIPQTAPATPVKKTVQSAIAKPEIPQTPVVITQPQPKASRNFAVELQEAQAKLKQENFLQARTAAQKILSAPEVKEYDPTWRQAAQIVSDANKKFSFSTLPCPEKTSYTIQEGDVLVRIAHRQKVSLLAIYAMNPGIKPRTLWVGRKLRYIDGNWSIKVSKSNFLLTLYRNGELFRVYPVGIGKDDRTPVGTFCIKDKVMNPAWDSPEGRILPNDPRNILGTRWMGLLATGNTSDQLIGYGIHGTTLPDTVGTPSSAGCVRLKNQDVEDLYTYIPEPDSATVPVLIIP